jgi:hypothetical protein
MKHRLSVTLTTALVATISIVIYAMESVSSDHLAASSTKNTIASTACGTDTEISATLQKLSVPHSYDEQQQSLELLRTYANKSGECKKQVIRMLTSAMDKPNLDLAFDRPSFYLWFYGTKLLAEWKAVETLDFLIAHLDLDDGSPFPLNHHPAVGAVIDMGELALPKLAEVLRANSDLDMRQYAVFCIASIGGPAAGQILNDALSSESDGCIRSFIQASLNAYDNDTRPDHVTSRDRAKWYSKFLCPGRFWIVPPRPVMKRR